MTGVPGLRLLALVVVTVGLAMAAGCNGGEESQQPPGTPGPASTMSPATAAPVGTPAATLEPRPTLTPGAYQPPLGNANLLGNPGFEQEAQYWFSLRSDQPVETSDVAHSGLASAHLQMNDAADATGAKVYDLIQEVAPAQFPEMISGYYRVGNWQRSTRKQYIEFVVVAFAPANLVTGKDGVPLTTPFPNYQIRYPLAGLPEEPFAIGNAFFKFISRDDPVQGQWVYFEANIKSDFQELWKAVPEGYSKIRVLFEVRYDEKEVGLPAEADVYYDDLYVGPADANPNKP